MYRLFIDEVGNHDLRSSEDPNHRYLGLTGVIMDFGYEAGQFTEALNELKQDIFGTKEVVLHRREILDGNPPFDRLRDEGLRERFDKGLLELLQGAEYRICTVVIDKKEHKDKYSAWRFHPYHYCLTVLLERYVLHLARAGQAGDVLVESRGKKENMQLERAYCRIYKNGTDQMDGKTFQARLSSGQLKIKPKTASIAGLQFADMIANPSCRALICRRTHVEMRADFGNKVQEILRRGKYLCRPSDRLITGWGAKWLP